jgi:hypothetical protein
MWRARTRCGITGYFSSRYRTLQWNGSRVTSASLNMYEAKKCASFGGLSCGCVCPWRGAIATFGWFPFTLPVAASRPSRCHYACLSCYRRSARQVLLTTPCRNIQTLKDLHAPRLRLSCDRRDMPGDTNICSSRFIRDNEQVVAPVAQTLFAMLGYLHLTLSGMTSIHNQP